MPVGGGLGVFFKGGGPPMEHDPFWKRTIWVRVGEQARVRVTDRVSVHRGCESLEGCVVKVSGRRTTAMSDIFLRRRALALSICFIYSGKGGERERMSKQC